MPCALTQDFTLDCRDSTGGLKQIYIIENANISSYTESSGTITAITKATGKRFYSYALIRETASAEETVVGSEQNGTIFYSQKVDIFLNKRQVNTRNEILLLAKNRLTVVAVDMNDNAWLFGRVYGVLLNSGTAPIGKAWGDQNGYLLTFEGKEKDLAPLVSSSLITALTTPG